MILVGRTQLDWRFSQLLKKAIVIVLSLFFVACSRQELAPHFTLSGETMGTTYHLTIVEPEGVTTNQAELQQAVDAQLKLINQQMSTYIDDSELSRFNDQPVGVPVVLSDNLFDVLMLSLEVAWLSDGAFDITVAPLVNLWGFGPGADLLKDEVPSAEAITAALQQVGFSHLEFDLVAQSVTKTQPLVLDLSAIAKGFGVDKVAGLLEYAGFSNFMVEIGGELKLKGNSPRGTPWRIAIEEPDPTGQRSVHRAVTISDAGMATSGDYRNFFEVDGKRYSHTIDPKTGYPITHTLASVTVIADTSAYADALATALNVMGPERGMKLAESQDLAVYMIIKTQSGFESVWSPGFQVYLSDPE